MSLPKKKHEQKGNYCHTMRGVPKFWLVFVLLGLICPLLFRNNLIRGNRISCYEINFHAISRRYLSEILYDRPTSSKARSPSTTFHPVVFYLPGIFLGQGPLPSRRTSLRLVAESRISVIRARDQPNPEARICRLGL